MSEIVIRIPLVSEATADAASTLITPVTATVRFRGQREPGHRARYDAEEEQLEPLTLARVSGWFMAPPG